MSSPSLSTISLFAGIGGIDLGAERAGAEPILMVENWAPARQVLAARFPAVAKHEDITDLETLPRADLVTAGFPCTDLSPAGRTAGIQGSASGLIFKALELIERARPPHVLIENVPNMLHLNAGAAIAVITERLEDMRYLWAYRLIDSRGFGVAQRRRRVFLLASREIDPAIALFAHDADGSATTGATGFGFYWTEGNRGVGWTEDALPTLKGGSTANVPSPPAVWLPFASDGERIVRPSITSVERAQGLPRNWTRAAPPRTRWKLVGNAVTPAVAQWTVGRIGAPQTAGVDAIDASPRGPGDAWPAAAFNRGDKIWRAHVSEFPVRRRMTSIADVMRLHGADPLSLRATAGFLGRLERSSLRTPLQFRADLRAHVEMLRAASA